MAEEVSYSPVMYGLLFVLHLVTRLGISCISHKLSDCSLVQLSTKIELIKVCSQLDYYRMLALEKL
jgi:hypothetical protein